MSKVYLSVIGNENGKTIDIPTGKTILGRGPLLGCADKKVSRNHAVLEVLVNGEMYLTPTHVNPCFYRTKLETSLRIIKKDAAQKIEPGDVFSLLPNSFQYEVCSTSSNDSNAKKEAPKPETDEKTGNRLNENSKSAKPVVEPTESEKSHENKIEEKCNESASLNETVTGKDETTDKTEKEPSKPDQNQAKTTPVKAPAEDTNKTKKKTIPKTPVDEISEVEEIPLDDEDDEEDYDDEEEWGASKNSKTSSSKSKTTQKASHRPRKRTLPSWLLKSASVPRLKEANGPSRQTPAKKTTGEKGRAKNSSRGNSEGQRSVSRSSRQKQTIQRISLDDFLVSEEDWSSEDEEEAKRKTKRRSSRRANEDSGSDWEFDNRKQQVGRWKTEGSSDSDWEIAGSRRRGRRRSKRYRDDSESGSDWETETRKKKPTPVKKSPRGRRSKRSEKEEEDDNDDDDAEEQTGDDSQSRPPSQGSSRKREPCLFGKKCYRKNTSHFEVYSHPGDSDYTSPDEDRENSDDKPECQYGIDCQRKNPKHRNEFRHTKKIRPKREASRKTGKKAKTEDDDNDPEDLSMEESDDYNPESDNAS